MPKVLGQQGGLVHAFSALRTRLGQTTTGQSSTLSLSQRFRPTRKWQLRSFWEGGSRNRRLLAPDLIWEGKSRVRYYFDEEDQQRNVDRWIKCFPPKDTPKFLSQPSDVHAKGANLEVWDGRSRIRRIFAEKAHFPPEYSLKFLSRSSDIHAKEADLGQEPAPEVSSSLRRRATRAYLLRGARVAPRQKRLARPSQRYEEEGDSKKEHFLRTRFVMGNIKDETREEEDKIRKGIEGRQERSLLTHAKWNPKVKETLASLEQLYQSDSRAPASLHYRCLILSQAQPYRGSAQVVSEILREMQSYGVSVDGTHLEAALTALAVHPDYYVRSEVIRQRQINDLELSDQGRQSNVVALIRERQFELAMHTIEGIKSEGHRIDDWVERYLMYCLCEVGEFEAALRLMPTDSESDLHQNLGAWYHLLGAASAARNHEAVSQIWALQGNTEALNPSTSVCHDVLATAAQAGDVTLATKAFESFNKRGESVSLYEYEYLLDAYAAAGDGEGNLRLLAALAKSGMEPEDSSTRSLTTLLRDEEHFTPTQAWRFLKSMEHFPIAAVNAIVEAHIERQDFDQAFAAFKEIRKLSQIRPNLRTFNLLFKAAFDTQNSEWIAFIHQEMQTCNIPLDHTSYELSIMTAVSARDYQNAWKHFIDLKESIGCITREASEACQEMLDDAQDVWAVKLAEGLKGLPLLGSEWSNVPECPFSHTTNTAGREEAEDQHAPESS
ncbi:MAG: hypothetical protein Q9227_001537 [Pyrenula ochraceoflavens]